MDDVEKTLEKRSVYGDYKANSTTVVEIKEALRDHDNWTNLEPYMQESLDMIAHKMGRILGSNGEHRDSWHDISGYATLIIRGKKEDS